MKLTQSPNYIHSHVAPHTGAWIETIANAFNGITSVSHPTRVRGLKPISPPLNKVDKRVAPHTGAWIETPSMTITALSSIVAPHTGAWIETSGQGTS